MSLTASSSLSLRRPVMKTYAPSLTKSFAVASAMPDVAAVMTATFPSSFPIAVLLRIWLVVGPGPLAHRYRQRALWTEELVQSAAGADKLAGDPLGVVASEEG